MSGEGGTPDEVKDLYKLLGNYERFTKEVDTKMASLSKQNGSILKKLNNIEKTCPVQQERITQNSEDIAAIEEHGVPSKTKRQININTILTALNGLVIIVKSWMGI